MQTEIDTMKKNIGMLRQWLNEDRITDPKKMVTNEELEVWLVNKENSIVNPLSTDWGDTIIKEFDEKFMFMPQGIRLKDSVHSIVGSEYIVEFLRSSLTRVVEEVISEFPSQILRDVDGKTVSVKQQLKSKYGIK